MQKTAPKHIITIDGPSGSGKGTLGRKLAEDLSWHFLDSGSLYRILAHEALELALNLQDASSLVALANKLEISFNNHKIVSNGQNVTKDIRRESCARAASQIAAIPAVRTALLALQHSFDKPPGLVADGRDMGTIVFVNAPLKFFVQASPRIRAERRLLQLQETGLDANLETLFNDILERDDRDRNRAVAPLLPSEEAIVVDTSEATISESMSTIWLHVQRVFGDVVS